MPSSFSNRLQSEIEAIITTIEGSVLRSITPKKELHGLQMADHNLSVVLSLILFDGVDPEADHSLPTGISVGIGSHTGTTMRCWRSSAIRDVVIMPVDTWDGRRLCENYWRLPVIARDVRSRSTLSQSCRPLPPVSYENRDVADNKFRDARKMENWLHGLPYA
jgi:hypothetical protein